MNSSARVLLALVAASATFAIAWLYTNRIDFPLLLSEGIFFTALIRFDHDRQIAVVLLVLGAVYALAGISVAMLWSRHPSLMQAIFLDPSISMIVRGHIIAGCAFLICGTGSYLWATFKGIRSPSFPRWQKTPFSVESDTPDHVIHIDRKFGS